MTVVISAPAAAQCHCNRYFKITRNPKVIWDELCRHPSCREFRWLQWDAAHLPPKLPLPCGRSPFNLIHPSLDRPHPPPQTASRSNQPFCHSTRDRPIDTWDWRQVCTNSCLRLTVSDAANNGDYLRRFTAEVMFLVRSVCLSVCLSVRRITRKLVNGF